MDIGPTLLIGGVFFVREEAHLVAVLAKSFVGVVLTQEETVFSTAREHTVRLVGALGDKVVNEDTKIGLVAAEDEGLAVI